MFAIFEFKWDLGRITCVETGPLVSTPDAASTKKILFIHILISGIDGEGGTHKTME